MSVSHVDALHEGADTAGSSREQRTRRCQGWPLKITTSILFFDGLRDHLHFCHPASGVQLRRGRCVSSLVLKLSSCSLARPRGCSSCLDSTTRFRLGLGLIVSPTKTEAVESSGPGTASFCRLVVRSLLYQLASFWLYKT